MSERPASEKSPAAARALAARADQVAFAQRSTHRRRTLLRRLTGGRLGRAAPQVIELDSPWQDTLSFERGSEGWRARTANLDGEEAFGVDYNICRRCRAGWVEQPFTYPLYQRCGLASAALAQLREEHPGYAWYTLGGHEYPARPFWDEVGAAVPGGYRQRPLCPHLDTSSAPKRPPA